MKRSFYGFMLTVIMVLSLVSCNKEHIHEYGEWRVTQESTCQNEGVETRFCDSCSSAENRTLPKKEHNLTYAFPGPEYHEILCTSCNFNEMEKHSYGDWVTESAATCDLNGRDIRHCICGIGVEREIEAIGHNFVAEENNIVFSTSICTNCSTRTFVSHDYSSTNECRNCEVEFHNSEFLEFTLIEQGTAYAVSGIGGHSDSCIVIPSNYNDLPVTQISAHAFENLTNIESLVIPNGVKVIGESAFSGCTNLKYALISENIETVGKNAFDNVAIKYIEAPMKVLDTISKEKVISITVNSGEFIPENYFDCCDIEGLFITDPSVVLDGGALHGCSELTSLTLAQIHTSSSSLDDEASYFGYVFGKEPYDNAVAIRQWFDEYNHAAYYDFYIPKNLRSLTVLRGNVPDYYFYKCDTLIDVCLLDGVDSVGKHAFAMCENLINVSLNATTIGEGAFAADVKIENLYMGARVSSIGGNSFWNLESLYIKSAYNWCQISFGDCNANPMYSAKHVYINDELCENFVVPEGITQLKRYAFYGAPFKSISIPKTVVSINSSALLGDENSFEKIVVDVNNELFTTQDGVLYDKNMRTLLRYPAARIQETFVIPASVETIAPRAFMFSSFKYIEIPVTVDCIGEAAFACTAKMEWISVPFVGERADGQGYNIFAYIFSGSHYPGDGSPSNLNKVIVYNCKSIPEDAFYKQNIEEVIIRDAVTIGNGAFYEVDGLTSVTLPEGLIEIGAYAFANCYDLIKINIPDSVRYIGRDAFRQTNAKHQENGVYYVDKWVVDNNPYVITSVILREDTVGLSEYAFSSDNMDDAESKLSAIVLPEGLKYINDNAFYGCKYLTSVHIPKTVVYIGNSILAYTKVSSITISGDNKVYHSTNNCLIETDTKRLISGIETSVIPEDGSVEIIEEEAFAGTGIVSLVIPDSVKTIGYHAFWDCSELQNIVLSNNLTDIEDVAFYYSDNLQCNEYDNAYYIGSEANPYMFLIRAKNTEISSCIINENTKFIGASAFIKCNNLVNINIPRNVIYIGAQAFERCGNLTSVTLEKNSELTSIGARAFYQCYSMSSITIGAKVQTIYTSAFFQCTPDNIYYEGNISDWNQIKVGEYNYGLYSAQIHYSYNIQ